jgi:hypothetical protein
MIVFLSSHNVSKQLDGCDYPKVPDASSNSCVHGMAGWFGRMPLQEVSWEFEQQV